MKTLRFFGMVLTAILLSVSFTACGDDDDDDNGGSGNQNGVLKVSDGTTKNGFNNAYYYFRVERNQSGSPTGLEVYCHLEFYTFDYLNLMKTQNASAVPSMFSYVAVEFLTGYEELSAIPTGTFPIEHIYAVTDLSKSEVETDGVSYGKHQYEDRYEGDNYYGNVQITKSGNGYSVNVTGAKVGDNNVGDNSPIYDASFSYTGTFSLVPNEYRDL